MVRGEYRNRRINSESNPNLISSGTYEKPTEFVNVLGFQCVVQIYGGKFIPSHHYDWLMVPHENLWRPVIKMPEQCKLCLQYFHQDIAGVCRSCYKSYKKWEYNQPSNFTLQGEEE